MARASAPIVIGGFVTAGVAAAAILLFA
jgi:hypothetical protein